ATHAGKPPRAVQHSTDSHTSARRCPARNATPSVPGPKHLPLVIGRARQSLHCRLAGCPMEGRGGRGREWEHKLSCYPGGWFFQATCRGGRVVVWSLNCPEMRRLSPQRRTPANVVATTRWTRCRRGIPALMNKSWSFTGAAMPDG